MKNISLLLTLCCQLGIQIAQAQQIEVSNLKKHIYYLADDKMQGRGTGSKEVFKAADNILKRNSKNTNLSLKVKKATANPSKPKSGK